MAQGDLFRATYEYNVARQPVTISLGFEHLSSTGDVEDELCSLIAIEVAGNFGAQQNLFAGDVTLEGCTCRKLTGMPAAPGEAYSQTVAGQFAGQSLPSTKAVMVQHKQMTADVRRNGKSYISGIPESLCEGNNVINQALLDAFIDLFDDLQQFTQAIPAGTATFRHVVLSRPAANPNSIVGLPVVSNTTRNILYNAKRRRTRELGYSLDTVVP